MTYDMLHIRYYMLPATCYILHITYTYICISYAYTYTVSYTYTYGLSQDFGYLRYPFAIEDCGPSPIQ